MVICHSYVTVYQRVNQPTSKLLNSTVGIVTSATALMNLMQTPRAQSSHVSLHGLQKRTKTSAWWAPYLKPPIRSDQVLTPHLASGNLAMEKQKNTIHGYV